MAKIWPFHSKSSHVVSFQCSIMSSPKIRLFISLSSPQSWNPHPSALQYRHPLDQRIRRQSSHKKLLLTKEGLENLLLLENEVIDLIYFLKPQSWRLPTCIRKSKISTSLCCRFSEAQCQVSARTSSPTSAETSPTFQRVILRQEQAFCEAILFKPAMSLALAIVWIHRGKALNWVAQSAV